MKAYLMHRDRYFDPKQRLAPPNERVLTTDLELDLLFGGMASGDKFLLEVVRNAVFSSLSRQTRYPTGRASSKIA